MEQCGDTGRSPLGLEPLRLRVALAPAGTRAVVMTKRFWVAARSADVPKPAFPGMNALVTTIFDLTPRAAPKRRGQPQVNGRFMKGPAQAMPVTAQAAAFTGPAA